MKRYSRRPFPPYRHRPGKTPHPERDPRGHLAGRLDDATPLSELAWSENEDYLYAVDLFNAGYFWEAHVFWEGLWAREETDTDERALLRGLIQLAAAALKREEGEPAGERKLVEKCRAAFAAVVEARGRSARLGVDVDRLLGTIDRGDTPDVIELAGAGRRTPRAILRKTKRKR